MATDGNHGGVRARLAKKIADAVAAPLPELTPRRVHGAVTFSGKVTAVIGMRRAGKTTFLHQQRRERHVRGIALERLPYLSFEDEELVGLAAKDLGFVLDEYYRRFPALRGHETVTFCFDEIQMVPGWERFVRRALDTEKVELFVSGSSAALLSREIATAMRGRAWEVVIHPFSFEEYLRHHRHALPEQPDFVSAKQRSGLERAFLDYLAAGGFPEVQGVDAAARRRVLLDYVDVAILRDIVERHQVSNVVGLRWMVRQLLASAASLFSVEKLYGALHSQGLRISKDTVHHLLAHLEDCFLVRTVWIDARSERRRMVNPRKVYPIDPALIPVFDRAGNKNIGHALETVVLLELERRHMEVTYVRTPEGHEVDFLARSPTGETELIQVCADLTSNETSARELRALTEARRAYPGATCRMLTLNYAAPPVPVPRNVLVQPAYEWLLTSPA
jgi:predicted AAA+ superfamily ATPase